MPFRDAIRSAMGRSGSSGSSKKEIQYLGGADDIKFPGLEKQPALTAMLSMQEVIFLLLGHANFAALNARKFAREEGCSENEVRWRVEMAVEDAVTVDMQTLMNALEAVRESIAKSERAVEARGHRAEDGYKWENKRKALLSMEMENWKRGERERRMERSQSLVGLRELDGIWSMKDRKGRVVRPPVAGLTATPAVGVGSAA